MLIRILIILSLTFNIVSCASVDHNNGLSPALIQLNTFRENESKRCCGSGYKYALGGKSSVNLTGKAELSDKLLSKGYGTGSLEIGITLDEKMALSDLLGKLNSQQIDKFLSNYQSCMNEAMNHFYKVQGHTYPEMPDTKQVVWGKEIYIASNTATAYATEKSGSWRTYELCVSIPQNAYMIKDSITTTITKGVGPGSWGDWRKDIKYVDYNAYGPVKACRSFDHQIHNQNRELKISVNYKLPTN